MRSCFLIHTHIYKNLISLGFSQYRYREGDCGNIAKVVIDLDELETTLHESRCVYV